MADDADAKLKNRPRKFFGIINTLKLLPLLIRFCIYYVKMRLKNLIPIMDLGFQTAKNIYGCPIGGIGAGTIGRGFKGEFCRFQLRPGLYDYITVPEDQFFVTIKDENDKILFQSVLATYDKPKGSPPTWEWNLKESDVKYKAIYPRSWTEYDLSKYGVKLTCRQISPIIPHNYKDSSLPCAVFSWNISNTCNEIRKITIGFTFRNFVGEKEKSHKNSPKFEKWSDERCCGITMTQKVYDMPCSFILSKTKAHENSGNNDFCKFNVKQSSDDVWKALGSSEGLFSTVEDKSNNAGADTIGMSSQIVTKPGSEDKMEFCLTWDMPIVHFCGKAKQYKRYYTKFFGCDGKAGPKIATYALLTYDKWEKAIDKWQKPILQDKNLPEWYKTALMNELYFVSDGGSVWFNTKDDYPEDDPRFTYGQFAYLEGHEYKMYNTYDVHFYASFALSKLWPNLQIVIQYEFRDSILTENCENQTHVFSGTSSFRKVKNSIPHDIGNPGEEPFILCNSYCLHDVSEWKDLNIKFILQVFRDYIVFNNVQNENGQPIDLKSDKKSIYDPNKYLKDMYPMCHNLIDKILNWDQDQDGLIENTGFPDQTYDIWVMSGPSAYCGGLWLAALQFMIAMATILNIQDDIQFYKSLLDKGKVSFEQKLWNGTFYSFDITKKNVVMADQLCGQWYLRSCGYEHPIFPERNVKSALSTIFENNVLKYGNGRFGAVNGYIASTAEKPGCVDYSCPQSEESWTGVTYGLAALMIHEGMTEQAFKTAGGMYDTLTNRLQLQFETPEALYENGEYRSIGYMRPLSIWAMQHALEKKNIKRLIE